MAEKKHLDLDKVLVEEIGQFGTFQRRTLLLTAVAVIFAGFHGEFVFTAARIETRCVIEECDVENPEWAPSWLSNAVPYEDGSFDSCNRFGNLTEVPDETDRTCPASIFDRNVLEPCEEFVYQNQLSVVYDFNLACDEWRRSLIGTIRTVGTLAALPITGYISDHWGRRVALTIASINSCWLGFTRYWVNTYAGFVTSQFAEAMLGSGAFSCVHVLLLELVGPKYRVICCAILTTFYAIGQVILGLVAWGLQSWRPLTLALYIPQVICIAYLWIIPESVRWYMSKGRFKELEELLKNIAQVNGNKLSENSLELLRKTVEDAEKEKQVLLEDSKPWLIVRVFQHKQVLLRCVMSPLWWISMTLIYHGLSINAVNMTGNPYLNYMLVCAVEIPGFWIGALLLPKFGRRLVIMTGFWICAASQIAYIFISSDMYGLSLAVYLIGKCCIAIVVTGLYVYTMEIYPTECRHSLFAFSSMIGRIGSITAPLTPAIGAATFDDMPFVIFGTMALASGLLVLLSPETLNTKLPDTMAEAELLGRKQKTQNNKA